MLAAGFGYIRRNDYTNYPQVVKVWDVASLREIVTLHAHRDTIPALAFSLDGKLLATASNDRTVRLWEVGSWKLIRTLRHDVGAKANTLTGAKSLAFSPDGRWLATGDMDGTLRIWEVSSGREIRRLNSHGVLIWALAFSPDGRTLASGSSDVKLWDVVAGRETFALQGATGCMAFSPDGNTLATGSIDFSVRLWHAASWPEIAADMEKERGATARAVTGRGVVAQRGMR
jgi:WD40 repeat protein